MRLSDKKIISLYNSGLNIRQIAEIVGRGRETVRVMLKRHNIRMRFRGIKYDPLPSYHHEKKVLLAELFGYLMGDGSVSKRKDRRFDCIISFSLEEKNFVDVVKNIVNQLFGYVPKSMVDRTWYRVTLRRSIARYLHEECGYPLGKKSVVNPNIPQWILEADQLVKTAFIRGFLNAEASINDCVKVSQSVRIFLPRDVQYQLEQMANIRDASFKYHSLRWRKAKSIVKEYVRPSNILLDLQKLLLELQINSKIYSNRIWMSSRSGSVSIHYELYMQRKMLERLRELTKVLEEKIIDCAGVAKPGQRGA